MADLSEQQEQDLGGNRKDRRSSGGFWFGVIILLIVFSVAGVGFYFFIQLRAEQADLGGSVKKDDQHLLELTHQITGFQDQIAALSADIASKDSHFNKTLDSFSQLHNERLETTRKELTDSITQLQRQLGKTRGDWLIADAEYLLVAASERLHLVGDVNTTREALEAADKRLEESGDAGVIKVREEIAKEIALVKNIKQTDTIGMYASIKALEDQVDKLTLVLPYPDKAFAPAHEPKKEIETAEESSGLLDKLKSAVTVRHSDEPIKKVLTNEEAQFIYGQLKVKLEMAKILLVQQNEALFQASLKDAQDWIDKNFAKNKESEALRAELDKLGAMKIQSQYPDISKSLKLIRDITKLRIETDKGAKAPEAGKTSAAEKTVEPVKPKLITPPSIPAKPIEPAKSETVAAPSEAAKPAEPAKPEAITPPVEPAKPAEAPKPAEPEKPASTDKPVEATTPIAPVEPAPAEPKKQ